MSLDFILATPLKDYPAEDTPLTTITHTRNRTRTTHAQHTRTASIYVNFNSILYGLAGLRATLREADVVQELPEAGVRPEPELRPPLDAAVQDAARRRKKGTNVEEDYGNVWITRQYRSGNLEPRAFSITCNRHHRLRR